MKKGFKIKFAIFLVIVGMSFAIYSGTDVTAEENTENIAAGIMSPGTSTEIAPMALNLSEGTYYLNNEYTGRYLKYTSSALSLVRGYISDYGTAIKWKLEAVDGGYVFRSMHNTTKYLGVASTTTSSTVEVVSVATGGSIPERCIWTIHVANGGCNIRSEYNSKYLYTTGSTLYTGTLPSANDTILYSTRVWRIANVNALTSSKELTASSKFSTLVIDVNETGTPTLTKSPTSAYWADADDFSYSRAVTTYVNVSNGVFTGKAEGITTVTATHKVTGTKFIFAVVVGDVPTYTISHYVDYGYRLRFGSESVVETYHDVLADKWERIFGVNLYFSRRMHTSSADSCKTSSYGSLTMRNLWDASCSHSTTHLTRDAMKNKVGNGTATNKRVIWTGHILNGNPPSCTWVSSNIMIITPWWCVNSDNYANYSDEVIRRQSICSLVHETGHVFRLHDHYCKANPEDRPCSNAYCDICVYGYESRRDCIMSSFRWDIETYDEAELFCTDCKSLADQYINTLQ